MKIALIGYEANIQKRVGSNQYAFELMKALYQLDQKNQYTVYLPTPPLPDLPPARDGWRYKVVGPSKLWNFFALPLALIKQTPKPDVVFNPGHYTPLFFPASLVVSIMDLGYLRFPQHYTKSIYWKLRLWTALSIKRAARLLTISQATKNDIIRYYKVKAEKIDVEYLGYDEKNFQFPIPDSRIEKAKNKYKIVGDYLLFLSTLKPSKNVEGLLKAFKSVKPKTKNKKLSLVIAGKKGWLFERIFEEVKALDLEEKVLFTDFVDEEDVPALMAGAKAFVLPSFWEGFGIPVVEAMAVGTPVVVSKAGSLPEIVNESGLIVDPGNTQEIARGINKIINDKTLGERLRKEGLFRVKKFNWDECARKTLLVLEKIGNNK